MKKKKKFYTSEYRVLKRGESYSIIKTYLNSRGKIIGYSDYLIPTGLDNLDLKLTLSSMLMATRREALTERDLKSIKN